MYTELYTQPIVYLLFSFFFFTFVSFSSASRDDLVDKENPVLERYDLAMQSVAIETDPSDFRGVDDNHHGKLFSETHAVVDPYSNGPSDAHSSRGANDERPTFENSSVPQQRSQASQATTQATTQATAATEEKMTAATHTTHTTQAARKQAAATKAAKEQKENPSKGKVLCDESAHKVSADDDSFKEANEKGEGEKKKVSIILFFYFRNIFCLKN